MGVNMESKTLASNGQVFVLYALQVLLCKASYDLTVYTECITFSYTKFDILISIYSDR